ncbi:MFS transporter [Porphyromonas sp.]
MTQQKQTQSYLVPFIIMVVLMALIGLITNLNQQFQAPMKAAYLLLGGGLTNTLTTALILTFFLAYLVMGVPSAKYIERKGYKSSLILGLVILIAAFGLFELSAYVFDTLDFPNFSDAINEAKAILAQKDMSQKDMGVSAMQAVANQTGNFELKLVKKTGEFLELNYLKGTVIPMAYWVFLLASFVAGTALTFLQAVVNPYLVACDVKGTSAVQRQSIAGAGNSAMTTIGPLLVALLIFQGKSGLDISITSLYVPIAVLIVLVGVIIFALSKLELPNIASTEKKEGEVLEKSVWSFSHLALGVVAIFMYVGVEVAVGANINLYAMNEGFNFATAAKMASLYWGGMLVGRLLGSILSKISASRQLTVASIGAGALVVIAMLTNNPWVLVAVGLFHSIMWPAIFSLAIDKLGKYTSAGSGALMMGIVGGAILPFIQGIAADSIGWQWTWAIVIIGEAYLLYYALVGHKVRQLP